MLLSTGGQMWGLSSINLSDILLADAIVSGLLAIDSPSLAHIFSISIGGSPSMVSGTVGGLTDGKELKIAA